MILHHMKKKKLIYIVAGVVALILILIVTVLVIVLTGKDSPGPVDPSVAVVPDAPAALTRDDALTDQTQVAFTWSAPENDGGS